MKRAALTVVLTLSLPLASLAKTLPQVDVTTTLHLGNLTEGTLTCFVADKAVEFPKGSILTRSDESNVLTISVGKGEKQTQYRLYNTPCIEVAPDRCTGSIRPWDCQP